MHAQSMTLNIVAEFNDLLDDEFDSFDLKRPFSRKPLREQTALLCEGRTWDDAFDDSDMLCELGE